MGVIQRQSIKNSFVDYIGVLIGVLSTLFIYPLDWELYGNIQYWLSTALIISPILRQGSTSLINKFFPYFRKNGIRGFLGLILLITTVTIIIMSALIYLVFWFVSDAPFVQEKISSFENLGYVFMLTLMIIYYNVFQLHSANALRIVVPNLISKIGAKIVTACLVLLGFYQVIGADTAAITLILFYLFAIILMLIYLGSMGKLDIGTIDFEKIKRPLKKRMFYYWLFGGLNFLGAILAFKIDIFMIGTFVNKESVGYYSVFLFMVNLMIIPMSGVNQIAGPIISDSFENNDISKIRTIYKKSSNSLLAIGSIIFLFIWLNVSFVLDFMRNGDDLLPFVFSALFLGISKIFDLMTSVNNIIIIYSKYYKYNLLFLFIMSVINISLNLWLIDLYGITGAAIATCISLFTLNAIKTLFIYKVLGVHPFSKKTVFIFLTLIIGLGVVSLFQELIIVNGLVSAIIYSVLLSTITLPLFYKMKLSEELNDIINKLVRRIRS